MAKTMLINMAEPEECRIAVVDNGSLEEAYFERDFENLLVGNVYLGRVTNVEPSMQAAFIDFGWEKNGFLHISDISFEAVLTEAERKKLGLVKEKTVIEDDIEEDDTESEQDSQSPKTEDGKAQDETSEDLSAALSNESQKEDQDETAKPTTKRRRIVRRVRKPIKKKDEADKGSETKTPEVKVKTKVRKTKVKKAAVKNTAKKTTKKKVAVKRKVKRRVVRKKKPEERRRRRDGFKSNGSKSSVAIQDVLKPGQLIVVQVTREAIDKKGPALTTFLSLAGRTLVYMPYNKRVGISRKIRDGSERAKLRSILGKLKLPEDRGVIIRTSGIGKEEADFKRDLKVLSSRYEKIKKAAKTKKKPCLLFEEADLAIRSLRDLYTDDIKSIIIDSAEGQKKVSGWLRSMIPGIAKRLMLHKDSRPLFHKFGIEEDFEKIFSRKVELKGGANLVIEQTEALVSIDVNTARIKEKDQNTAIFNANKAAAVEIPRQLRLRDMGGLIICDFIDMTVGDHRRQIEKLFSSELKKDRARVKSSRISQFGLIEVSRQRMRQSVERAAYMDCPHCEGTGKFKNESSMALKVLRSIKMGVSSQKVETVEVTAQTSVIEFLQNKKRRKILDLEENFDKIILLHGDPHCQREDFSIQYLNGEGRKIEL